MADVTPTDEPSRPEVVECISPMEAQNVDPIRGALTEAIAAQLRESWGTWFFSEAPDGPAVRVAQLMLSVVESWTQTKPCPKCGGTGKANDDTNFDCRTCRGEGSLPPEPSDVPGIIELLMEISHPAIDMPADAVAAGAPAHLPASYRLRERPIEEKPE